MSGIKSAGYPAMLYRLTPILALILIGANGRMISSPERAVFFHPLANDLTFSRYHLLCIQIGASLLQSQRNETLCQELEDDTQCGLLVFRYWNYLRKQTIVLETYNTTFNYWMNRGLFFVHCWLSWSFVFPYITTLIHLIVALRVLMGAPTVTYSSCTTGLFCSLPCRLAGAQFLFALKFSDLFECSRLGFGISLFGFRVKGSKFRIRIRLHLAVFVSTAKHVELLIISNLLGLTLGEIYWILQICHFGLLWFCRSFIGRVCTFIYSGGVGLYAPVIKGGHWFVQWIVPWKTTRLDWFLQLFYGLPLLPFSISLHILSGESGAYWSACVLLLLRSWYFWSEHSFFEDAY